jgi:cellobiose-specific phosphotransferase system component IIA
MTSWRLLIVIAGLALSLLLSALSNMNQGDIIARQSRAMSELQKADASLKKAGERLQRADEALKQACFPPSSKHEQKDTPQ